MLLNRREDIQNHYSEKKIILFRNFQANKLSLFTMYDILKGEANVSLWAIIKCFSLALDCAKHMVSKGIPHSEKKFNREAMRGILSWTTGTSTYGTISSSF